MKQPARCPIGGILKRTGHRQRPEGAASDGSGRIVGEPYPGITSRLAVIRPQSKQSVWGGDRLVPLANQESRENDDFIANAS